MHGDYSRGHEPDRKRGRDYRRVLLQMGRPVLDSDVAASVDALLGEVRAATRGLSCAAGSPDLGFLVTPGRLLSIFARAADRLTVTAGAPDAWVDYRHRYLGRYPALHVAAGGQLARLTLPPLERFAPAGGVGRVALWARVEQPVTISLNGLAVSLAPQSPDVPARVELNAGAALDPLEIEVPAGGAAWLFVLEEDSGAGREPAFAIAPGSYHVDGLLVDAHGGGAFPAAPFPPELGFPWAESPPQGPPLEGLLAPPGLAVGTRLVAYLDVHERHITHVEDPGIREEALGATDTSARAQLVGQVKLAMPTGVLPPAVDTLAAALRSAFASVVASGGRLTIDVPEATPTTDPCALPDPAGYSGADNRLYRVEVHFGGGLSQVRLKWSRDNGSELYTARVDESENLVLPADTPLAAGDLVEVLSHVVDLGDERLAQVSAGGLQPPQSAVGQLVQLAAVGTASSSDEVVFTLVDPDDVSVPVALDGRYGVLDRAVLKLRRWHGIVDPQRLAGGGAPSPGPHALEDGITVELSSTGFYRPGQYWQYEARVRHENANGPWRPEAHGPEHRYAPLALLEFRGDTEPLELLAWLDERFGPPCDLDADAIGFAGGRVGTESDTVQEALEELYDSLLADWPTVAAGGINWTNDRVLALTTFNAGLQVTFSEEMHPATATPSAFVVSLELPAEEGAPGRRRPVVVDGRVDVSGATWTFVPSALDAADVGRWVSDLGGPVRCRVRLAGEVILDRAGERPLDGEAVGRLEQDGYETYVDLRLPSGDGRRGGNFESWFFLTGPPPRVAIEHMDPPDGAHFAAGTGPRSILVSFTEGVLYESIDSQTLIVSVRHSSEPERRDGDPIAGTISPYPFESSPRVVNRVSFVPDDPEALRPTETRREGPWIFSVRARGTGSKAIVDAERRPLDGARSDEPSDFVGTFAVDTAAPR